MTKYGRKVKIFSALEVANICGVVNQTAINWVKNGYLKAFVTPGGQYRIYAKDLAAFLDKRGMADSGETLNVILERADCNIIAAAVGDQAFGDLLKDELFKRSPDRDVIVVPDFFELGRLLADLKPGVIILDLSLQGIDHDRLIHTLKEDPALGKPLVYLFNAPGSHYNYPDNDGIFTMPDEIEFLLDIITRTEKYPEFSENIG